MQTKTAMKYHYTPRKMGEIQNWQHQMLVKYGASSSHSFLVEMKNDRHFGRQFGGI